MPRFARRAVSGLLLSLVLACSGLAEMKDMLAGIQALQAGLVQDLQEPNTNVNVTNTTLVVTFVNSRFADEPEEQRAKLARHVAEFVRDHYVAYSKLTTVGVGFRTQASVGVASAARTTVPYSFATTDLGPAPSTPTPPTPSDTSAHQAT